MAGQITDIAWVSDSLINYVKQYPHASDAPPELWRHDAAGETLLSSFRGSLLAWPADCSVPYILSLSTAAPKGALATIACDDTGTSHSRRLVVSIDPDNDVTVLVSVEKGWGVAWQPGGDYAVVELGERRCHALAPLVDGKVQPWTRDTFPWGELGSGAAGQCDRGQSAFPAVTKSGDVVFLASGSVHALTAGGDAAVWDLYRMESQGVPDRVVTGFVEPFGVAVLDNIVVVSASRDSIRGLWLVDLDANSVTLLAEGDFSGLSGAPAADAVGAIRWRGSKTEIVRIAVPH